MVRQKENVHKIGQLKFASRLFYLHSYTIPVNSIDGCLEWNLSQILIAGWVGIIMSRLEEF